MEIGGKGEAGQKGSKVERREAGEGRQGKVEREGLGLDVSNGVIWRGGDKIFMGCIGGSISVERRDDVRPHLG